MAIVAITLDFFPPQLFPAFPASISKVAYFFTTTALLQGMGNLVWMPLIVKYGRRPVYVASFTIYTVTAIWAGVATQYTNELVARIIMGFAAGSGECLAPLTIADMFFLHERGTIMAYARSRIRLHNTGADDDSQFLHRLAEFRCFDRYRRCRRHHYPQ